MTAPVRLSVAIPIYNELELLPGLLRRVGAVVHELPGGPHEIVIVETGARTGHGRRSGCSGREAAR